MKPIARSAEPATAKNSYSQILKASSIMGGAAGITLLLGMVRVKFAAVLIGTTGVGLLASFAAVQGLIGTLAGLGIQSSAVRDIAAAVAQGDPAAMGRKVRALRRICWLTGLVGMAAMALLSPLISQLTFGSGQYQLDIAALGIVILLANLSGGQMALIQGMRRIGDMARANIFGAALGTAVAIGLYTALGLRGIVPTLVAVAAIQLALSWFYARRVPVPEVALGWRDTFTEAGGMVRLGLVFMWNGLMGSAVSYATVALITQQQGLPAVGLYSAAFALSGAFVGFVLGAMGADYYPRLTAVAHDKPAMCRMVNEQTEIGLLLALPGLMATIIFAPWAIRILYTSDFLPAAELIQWLVLGCFGRVISWPLGYMLIATSKTKLTLIVETSGEIIHLALIFAGIFILGIKGVAIAFPVLLIFTTSILLMVTAGEFRFKWTRSVAALILKSGIILLLLISSDHLLPQPQSLIFGLMALIVVTISVLHELKKNVVTANKIIGKVFILLNHPILKYCNIFWRNNVK